MGRPAPDLSARLDAHERLSWHLRPGDAVAFDALTFHHATGNSDVEQPRAGYALRYMGETVRYKEMAGMNERVFNPELNDGDVMDSEQYPVVYPQ